MSFLRSLSQKIRALEWIFLTAHLGMWLSAPGYHPPIFLGFCGGIFLLSWIFPSHRARWQRLSYILLALMTLIIARVLGIELGIFFFIYFAKSYFLLGHRLTIGLICCAAIPWTVGDTLGNLYGLQQPLSEGLNIANPWRLMVLELAGYVAASFFTIMICQMLLREHKSYQKIEELSGQVESLVATLERTRIAREIHDSLGHTLTDLHMQLSVAQALREQNPTQAFQAVDTATMLARQCIEDVSQSLNRMRQSDFDLNQVLIGLLEQLRQTSTMQVKWQINLPKLPIYKSYQIYCIVKEGLMNVQKHARASKVSLSAHQTSDKVILELRDDGVGFELGALHPGFGLQGMMERCQLLGGQLSIETASNQGTQICITLPV